MLKSKLEQFLAKRVIIYFVILSILDVILVKNRWFVLMGLFTGSILSIAKFSSYSWIFGKILCVDSNASKNKSPSSVLSIFALNQLVILLLLFLAYYIQYWIFVGFVCGILLVPLAVMINSITEVLGITKNHFE